MKLRASRRKADDDFRASERGFEASIRLFYRNSERKRRSVGTVGWEVCYATKKGASQTRRGGGDATVIVGEESMMNIQD